MAGTVADITERKRIDQELVDARARLDAALEAGAIATWMWNIPENRMVSDTGLPRFFNLSASEGEDGTGDRYIEAIHPDDWPRVSEALRRSVETGEAYEADYRMVQEDGTDAWVIARGRVERDETGRPLRMPGVLVDITERKRLEEELRLRVEQLDAADRRREELLVSLRQSEETLRDTDRRKDEFLATLAHELRNPLAPIRHSLQILKMPRIDAATAEQTRNMMERQVHHLVRLVDDLLDVSRVMRGKIELRKESVELATVVARAVETAQPLLEAQGHGLEISLSPDSLLVEGDPVRLSQVVGNLLMNSAKYTEPGGRISLVAGREGGEAVLRVRDNGIGIDPGMLPHIFELFVQADHGTTRSHGGLGIGLTLVKNLVELHGGVVEAHSAGLGEGCELVVRLPLQVAERPAAGERELGGPAAVAPSGHRILVVDDNQDAALTLALLLRWQGHEVEVAHDGAAALETVTSFRPALVLLDIGMPGMDGYEVARRIRATPELKNVVLAALTGWGQPEDLRRSAQAGFDHHLVKPLEAKVLERLLAELRPAERAWR
jgi:signal transduction histidine kinase/CheY-like chemotaxis protein